MKRGSIQSCGCLDKENRLLNIKKAQKTQFVREPRLASAIKVYNSIYKDGDITFELFVELTQQNCFYCGIAPGNTYNIYTSGTNYKKYIRPERVRDGYFTYNGLDRVDNRLPHNKNNVVTCCEDCNRAKLERTKEEFLAWAHRICLLHPAEDKSL